MELINSSTMLSLKSPIADAHTYTYTCMGAHVHTCIYLRTPTRSHARMPAHTTCERTTTYTHTHHTWTHVDTHTTNVLHKSARIRAHIHPYTHAHATRPNTRTRRHTQTHHEYTQTRTQLSIPQTEN